MKPDRSVRRVHGLLIRRGTPQAVLRDRDGKFELVPAGSSRAAAIVEHGAGRQRFIGVFAPDVPFDLFSASLIAA